MLRDRGLGAAGVSIDPRPAASIRPGAKAFLSALPMFLAWHAWSRGLTMRFAAFARNFANGLPEAEQRAAYARHIVPAPGRIYYQSVLGLGAGVAWKNPDRTPLLLVSGEDDRTVEPGMVLQNLMRRQTRPNLAGLRGPPQAVLSHGNALARCSVLATAAGRAQARRKPRSEGWGGLRTITDPASRALPGQGPQHSSER